MGARGDIIRAVVAGRQAGRNGDPVTACPYPATSLLRTAWIKGYTETKPRDPAPDGDD
ncbi:Rmf/CrpP fold protein [Streptomyces sp. BB1-1-1]|uniref:Rmf/CrpP fold protein n=1 Tax=Streptomyces sp. BB1-1-1 TaxID=3074430 RepID=UPI0028775C5A|nr:Rmf/CrpP fold protein [Streptomyces sp. BB1-1-1]WND36929.1 Rmf/CrpP fold protein [Streptomyces sp. BB1-1-1]